MSVYLDYNASSPIEPEVLELMIEVYKNNYGNADSRTHDYGESARRIVETARGNAAKLLDVSKEEIFFTSGSTESNNMAILGMADYGNRTNRKHIIVSGIEHKAVLEAAKSMERRGFELEMIQPGMDGRIDAEEVLSKVREDTLLVSIMHVNNETGIIQPVNAIGEALQKTDIYFHTDATQSCGKLVDEVRNLKYDMMSVSAHKMGGPQGIGILVLKRRQHKLPPLTPIIFGGHQEHGLRPGTMPVALIAGFGKACEVAQKEHIWSMEVCKEIKGRILNLLDQSGLEYEINGNQEYCIPTTLNFGIRGVASEALMLSTKEYCGISNGSACTSKEYSYSYVLKAMGFTEERMERALRISWGSRIDLEEVLLGFGQLLRTAKALVF